MSPQRAVRPVLIVVSFPLQDLLLRVIDREEELDVQMLVAQPSIEALDERIVHGFARSAEDQPGPLLIGQGVCPSRVELRAVVPAECW